MSNAGSEILPSEVYQRSNTALETLSELWNTSTDVIKAIADVTASSLRSEPDYQALQEIKIKHDKVFSIEEVRVRELIDISNEDWDEELIEQLVNYLKELPTEMLEVLELRFFEDKDFKEIAFILDISESGAKMRTYRALDKLRKNFNLKITYDGKK